MRKDQSSLQSDAAARWVKQRDRAPDPQTSYPGLICLRHFLPPQEIPEHDIESFAVSAHVGKTIRGEIKENGRWKKVALPPASVFLFSPGPTRAARWSSASQSISIIMSPVFISKILGVDALFNRPSRHTFDPELFRLIEALDAEVQQGSPTGQIYGETLGCAIALRYALLHKNESLSIELEHGKFAPSAFKRVVDYIEENLDARLSLIDLATQAHMSPFHFARAFKATTGVPPHQFVIQRRIERATRLVRHTRDPLSQIALQCGFSNQSHFHSHFKRVTGTTPSKIRGV